MDQDTPEVVEDEESFADRAYRKVEELIVSLQVEPGTVLTEQGLAAQLGLGRTPIREALQRLAREHLVVIMPRRGIQVTEMSVAEQMAALEVRRELERYVAASAARRTTPGEKARFSEMAELMTRAAAQGDEVTFLRLDREFNVFAAQCARNAYAEAAIAPLHALSRRFWTLHLRQAGDMPQAAAIHSAIMLAIAAGDEEAAAQASDRLLDWAQGFTAKTTVP
jgi:DNA-binding GntR family transcriptional regulator|tara:strand:- start:25 stop:693 length:669 start_codon:yes stop_codon:yes gene_type:complete